MRSPAIPAGLLLLLLLPAAPAAGQARLELGALAGAYAPLGSFDDGAYSTTGLPQDPADLAGLALGAAGRGWFGPRFGVQLAGMLAPSRVGGGAAPGGPQPGRAARVFSASAQLLVRLSPSAAPARVWLGAGPGLVRHGGEAYAPYGHPTRMAAVVSVGAALPVARRLDLQAGLTTLAYRFSLRDRNGTQLEHGGQIDALLQGGVSWRLR